MNNCNASSKFCMIQQWLRTCAIVTIGICAVVFVTGYEVLPHNNGPRGGEDRPRMRPNAQMMDGPKADKLPHAVKEN